MGHGVHKGFATSEMLYPSVWHTLATTLLSTPLESLLQCDTCILQLKGEPWLLSERCVFALQRQAVVLDVH